MDLIQVSKREQKQKPVLPEVVQPLKRKKTFKEQVQVQEESDEDSEVEETIKQFSLTDFLREFTKLARLAEKKERPMSAKQTAPESANVPDQ